MFSSHDVCRGRLFLCRAGVALYPKLLGGMSVVLGLIAKEGMVAFLGSL